MPTSSPRGAGDRRTGSDCPGRKRQRYSTTSPAELGAASDEALARRLRDIRWDGFAFCCDRDSTLMILLNPARSQKRQTATLMEEFSHHLLGHKPCSIRVNPNTRFLERSYDQAQEAEAYDLGAAILLPKERIQYDVGEKRLAHDIAAIHGCSEELVVYRIKRMRLWKRYERYAA